MGKRIRKKLKTTYPIYKGTIISFGIICFFTMANFLTNVEKYKGYDVSGLINPVRMLLLSAESGGWHFYFMQLYPILVVLPAGYLLWNDYACGEHILQIVRIGRKKYYASKIRVTFLITFGSFLIPLLSEMLWHTVAFPINTYGNTYGRNAYDGMYVSIVKTYAFSSWFVQNPYLYAMLWILFFCAVSGFIAVFVMSLAVFIRRYKIALLLPGYMIICGMVNLRKIFALPFSTDYFQCLSMLSGASVNIGICIAAVMVLFLLSVISLIREGRHDVLR